MANMDLWNAVKQPPKTALKQIRGGRLSGMTDINPQWRMEVMTEQYGPCGDGWKYTIDRVWTEPGTGGQIFAFALVSVYFVTRQEADDPIWSEPIPGIGGNMLVAQEKNGLHCNDEAFKMAVTDALSVALKSLGIGADIYYGRWDGSKYLNAPQSASKPVSQQTGATTQAGKENASEGQKSGSSGNSGTRMITSPMQKKIYAVSKALDIDITAMLKERYSIEHTSDLTFEQGKKLIDWLEEKQKKG